MTRSRIALAISAALVSLAIAGAPAFADDMKKGGAMSSDNMTKSDGMKKQGTTGDNMTKGDGMKKEGGMSSDNMSKGDGMKK